MTFENGQQSRGRSESGVVLKTFPRRRGKWGVRMVERAGKKEREGGSERAGEEIRSEKGASGEGENRRARGRARKRSVELRGRGTIPVRLSAVRTSAVLLQSRIRRFTRAHIGTLRTTTVVTNTRGRARMCDVAGVGLEWTQKRDSKGAERVFRPW
ncbi:hypothetical protein KM043_002129 [Ampulex compressa]|nr:hypothetical protein KM043_002129 [Ampulex compressa]